MRRKTSRLMNRFLEDVTKTYNVDLSKPGISLRIHNPPYMRLCIERLDNRRIAITHYRDPAPASPYDDLVADPDVEFLETSEGFSPFSYQDTLTYNCYIREDKTYNADGINDLVSFCDVWAKNLRDQGFLKSRDFEIEEY